MSQRHRTSEAALRQLRARLSDRDLSVLSSVAEYRLMTGAQIVRLHFSGHASPQTAQRICRRTLKRLFDARLLKRLDRRIGGIRAGSAGHIHAVTPLGHRLLGNSTRKRWREPSATFVDHTLAIAELGTLAVRQVATVGGEAVAVQPEPAAWRTYHDGIHDVTVKPDLALVLADQQFERSWFVEVDLDTESRTVIERKCRTYTRYWRSGIEQESNGVFPQVLWIAPTDRRAELIASTFARTGIEARLFAVTTTNHAVSVLVGDPALTPPPRTN